ncbi:Vph2 protein [Saccharomycopsis crataegensis]|uniref:Vph2 protein n=1 Tax=Saccharomycopsis crataegensis TaxID=43959 RepID=A0AAV5QLP9_9ASCO|nr:Vph2 protein [Saccharomycopsis crataegensis]
MANSSNTVQTTTKFVIDDNLKHLINSHSELSQSVKDTLLQRQWISLNDTKALVISSATTDISAIPKILSSLKFYFPPKPKTVQTPEFQRQLQRLRNLEEERRYQEMAYSDKTTIYDKSLSIHQDTRLRLDGGEDDDVSLSPSQFSKQVKEQMTTILNILITAGSVAFAVWYWTKTSMTNVSISTRVFLSMAFGFLVLVAEVVVYNGYLRRMDDAKQTERRKKEKKKVVKTITIKGGEVIETDVVQEKEKNVGKHKENPGKQKKVKND